jgi:hypothetical protein
MNRKEHYKITVKGDTQEYQVVQNGDVTHVVWLNSLGKTFSLAYNTTTVIQHLKEGKWIRVKGKKAIASKPNNLFSFEDID